MFFHVQRLERKRREKAVSGNNQLIMLFASKSLYFFFFVFFPLFYGQLEKILLFGFDDVGGVN